MIADTLATNGATYIKVPNVAGLYRHSRSGRYYGAEKTRGKRRDVSLRTTDRQIAERRMRDWVRNIDRVDHEKERTTFAELINISFLITDRFFRLWVQILQRGVEAWNAWRRTDLSLEPDLSGVCLPQENLGTADFSDTNLSGADLGGVNFTNADLGCADLSRANLRGAVFRQATLYNASLEAADLEGADLGYAQLVGTNLRNAKLTNCWIYKVYAL